jgi:predicted house-cleaning noncanonical NTP pyrophosphatase (MazG superfamily)
MEAKEYKNQFVKQADTIFASASSDIAENNYNKLENMAHEIAEDLGYEKEDLERIRTDKNSKNGYFDEGYILSEKVLPVTADTNSNKLLRDDKRDALSHAHEGIVNINANGIKKIPEKLVRDQIPLIIERQAKENNIEGYKAKVRKASGKELIKFIRQKYQEERNEFIAAEEIPDQIEDMIDILDVSRIFVSANKILS